MEDAHFKWIEVRPVNSATSTITIDQLRSIFAKHGLPEMFVMDDGSALTSEEFSTFTKQNGIRYIKSCYGQDGNNLALKGRNVVTGNIKLF